VAMLARIGGDEFALIVPEIARPEDVLEIARRIKVCFDTRFSIEGNLLEGAASLGVAFYPVDGRSKDELLNAADAAMYAEKNARKSQREYVSAGSDLV
jgi:diguanylate cyclase (GGDEF)-like protein